MEDSVKNIDAATTSTASPNIGGNDAANKPANSQENSANLAANLAAEPEQKKKRSVGNKIYDFGVFGSVAFAGVSAMSAITGYEAMYGTNKKFDWLRTANTKIQNGVSNFLSKTVMKKSQPTHLESVSKNITMTFVLGMGAHILMPLIKWMEDNRQKNAAKIDTVLGTTPPDKDVIANEVKQSWKSVFVGRMMSWGAAFTAVIAIGPKLMEKMTHFFGEKGENAWMKLKPQANQKTVRQWSNLIVFDAIGTAVTAVVMFVSSRFFAKRDAKKHGDGDALYELNINAPNPFGDVDEPQKNNSNFAQKIKAENRAATIAVTDPNIAFADKIKNESSVGNALV